MGVPITVSAIYIREHQQKTFVTLSGFWPLRGIGGGGGGLGAWVNLLKKEKS